MKILVTGSSGFIGSHLHASHPELIKTLRFFNQSCVKDNSKFIVVPSINGNTDWGGRLQGINAVIHLSGLAHSNDFSIEDYQSVNIDGVLNLARQAAIAGVERFVFLSTVNVCGVSTTLTPFSKDSVPNPISNYAKSKYDAELGLKRIAKETGLEVVIIRSTLVYGPNAPGNFGVLTKLVKKLSFLPFGLSKNKRDFISIQNLASLLVTCANHPSAAGHTFLASDGETVSIKDFTNAIAIGLNKKLIQLPVPVSIMRFLALVVGKSAMAEQVLGNLQVDSSNAQEVLGWVPPYTMEQAMASLSEYKK
ncbi:NAD-dependent epimerase/dehydratase family protein [Shewanella insulae]|uniref:NAD-dependent epimerase/dehydratase family protein n=1 Tax=Shewanella insulae TaxID=2681496 RepID=UPI0024812398|nr:NAD-dependent epimerase/dehydratase family protein [Shewanella insulae]